MERGIMMKRKGFSLLIVLLTVCLTLSGCWSRREMEGLAYILILGIDRSETGDIKLVAQFGLPATEEAGDEPPVTTITAEGRDFNEALDDMFTQSSRRPYLSHLRLVVLGEELAKSGIWQSMDFLRRDVRMRLNTKIVVTQEDLEDLLETVETMHSQPALAIIDQFRFNAERSRIVRAEIMDVVAMLLEPDLEPVMPMIEAGEDRFTMGETAIFSGPIMVGQANKNQTFGLLLLQNRVRGGVVVVPCGEDTHAALQILSSNTNIETSWLDDQLHVSVLVESKMQLNEFACTDAPDLQRTVEHHLVNLMNETIELSRDLDTDFMGLAFHFRRTYPEQWSALRDRWPEILNEASFDLQSRVHIRRQGQIPR
ncbi:MAG: Ger(x)C family spore germination protein [Firmicutes bacterium]|nr:Ger(x)C family spore germination protein [Bacillota bacterium]